MQNSIDYGINLGPFYKITDSYSKKCQGHEKEKLRNRPRLPEILEDVTTKAMWDPGLDPGVERRPLVEKLVKSK